MPSSTAANTKAPVDRPFVLLLKTPRGRYAYDVNTSRILRLSHHVFERLREALREGLPTSVEQVGDRDAGLHDVLSLREKGLLLGKHPHAIRVDKHRRCIAEAIRTSLSQLTLEVTETCNLRCLYCIYGAGYDFQRSHGLRRMSMDVVEKALEYFYGHNAAAPFVSVGFYGGEPLTAFNVIKEATSLTQGYSRGHETHLHMTTNGTLLTKEKFRFLVDHQFALLVSLDGPAEVHDRYRRSARGQGTWRRITDNLRALREYSPEYYRNKVMFSCVRVPATSMATLLRFFSRHVLFRSQSVQVSAVNDGCPALMSKLLAEVGDRDENANTRARLVREYLGRVVTGRTRGSRFRFLQSVYGSPFVTLHRREICAGPCTSNWLNGMCIPAWRKLFVARDGQLFTCERVGRALPIGHVNRGVNLDSVLGYLEEHREFNEAHCRGCWAVRLCSACQSTIGGPAGVDADRVKKFCDGERARQAELLLQYIQVLEANPRAFDFIEEMSVS